MPSLLPLLLEALERLSSSARGTVGGMMREMGRGGGVGLNGEGMLVVVDGEGGRSRFSGRVTDDLLRAAEPPTETGEGPLATTLDRDTDVVAGVTVGLRTLDARLGGVDALSKSTVLRLGDEFEDWTPSIRRSGVSMPLRWRRSRSPNWSIADGDGTDDEIAVPLEVLDRVADGVCGLPPDRTLPDVGLRTVLGLLDGELPPLFFRSLPGLADVLNGVDAADAGNCGRGGPRDCRVSSTALISCGMVTL